MLQYFLRRLLLTIPTFIGATMIVFFIVQIAPGGPLEQQIMAIKAGSGAEGGGGSAADNAGSMIPQSALEQLKRYYGFDKPVWVRYLIWLGLYPRETDSFDMTPNTARNVGEGKRVYVERSGNTVRVLDDDDRSKMAEGWEAELLPKNSLGEEKIRIFRSDFKGILNGYFGDSYTYREPVIDLITARMGISLQFGLIGFIISYTVCVYLGIQKAIEHGSVFDLTSSILVFVAYSIPGWALGFMLLVLLGGGSFWDVLPLGGFQSANYPDLSFFEKILDRAKHAILPTIAYTITSFATLTVLMKNSLLENLSQDYVRTAFAKGLSERRVIWVHGIRNSIIPIMANIGFVIGIFLTGSYFVERVFNINGIGLLSFEAVLSRDYPIVFAFTVINVLILLIGSILSDLALALVDPRIRFK
ncbi:MAG TPA: ABC transporter permease subunit [Patescibacteria group bacterium]|nr:ABC transporter permease subunit [Patescibacteria group bacterium]